MILPTKAQEGITLAETLIAILILSCGLLATGQLMYVALGSASLSRSKSGAMTAAQHKLECLADLYCRNSGAAELSDGKHGPEEWQIVNPAYGTTLNRFAVAWTVGAVADPRPGRILAAKAVTAVVTPIDVSGNANEKSSLNKVVRVATIFSRAIP
jgi:type II secretory pathway pseudopilin PulG